MIQRRNPGKGRGGVDRDRRSTLSYWTGVGESPLVQTKYSLMALMIVFIVMFAVLSTEVSFPKSHMTSRQLSTGNYMAETRKKADEQQKEKARKRDERMKELVEHGCVLSALSFVPFSDQPCKTLATPSKDQLKGLPQSTVDRGLCMCNTEPKAVLFEELAFYGEDKVAGWKLKSSEDLECNALASAFACEVQNKKGRCVWRPAAHSKSPKCLADRDSKAKQFSAACTEAFGKTCQTKCGCREYVTDPNTVPPTKACVREVMNKLKNPAESCAEPGHVLARMSNEWMYDED